VVVWVFLLIAAPLTASVSVSAAAATPTSGGSVSSGVSPTALTGGDDGISAHVESPSRMPVTQSKPLTPTQLTAARRGADQSAARQGSLRPVNTAALTGSAVEQNSQSDTATDTRNASTQIVTNLTADYEYIHDHSLNASYWEARGNEQATRAIERLNPLPTDAASAGEEALTAATKKLGGKAAGSAIAVYAYTEMAVSVVQFVEGIRSRAISETMPAGSADQYEGIRENIAELADNSNEIERASNVSERQDLYQERQELLKETYTLLPTYTTAVYQKVNTNPTYSLIGIPGTSYNIGRTSYSGIRGSVAQLRLAIVLDYHATSAWLQNDTDTTHIARTFSGSNPSMPTHNLDYSTKTARVYDSLDVPDDYTVHKIQISSKEEEIADELRVRIQSPDTENFSAFFKQSGFQNFANPDAESFETAYNNKQFTLNNPEAGDYYILVKSERRSLPYVITASVIAGDSIPLIDINRKAPNIQPVKRGFTELSDAEIPDTPRPTLTNTHLYPTDDGYKVTVSATNRGDPSDWQSMSVGLPNVSSSGQLSIAEDNLEEQNIIESNTSIGSEYGSDTTKLSYPVVETAESPWQNKNGRLAVNVNTGKNDTYQTYIKTVAQRDGTWYSDPSFGNPEAVDGQSEYVKQRNITLRSYDTQQSKTWRMAGKDASRRGSNRDIDAPTDNVSLAWKSNINDIIDSPIIIDNTVYVSTANGNVIAVNRSSGSVRWNRSVADSLRTGPVFESGVLTVSVNSKITMLNAADGSLLGEHSFNSRIQSQPTSQEDILYVPTNNNKIHALDLSRDEIQWTTSLGGTPTGSPALAGNRVYITLSSGHLVALDKLTGIQRWKKSTQSSAQSVVSGEDRVYATTAGGSLIAYDQQTGTSLWDYHVGGKINSRVGTTNNQIFIATGSRVVAISKQGRWQWTKQFAFATDTAPVVANQSLFVGSQSGQRIFALDTSDGSLRWERYSYPIESPLAIIDGAVFAETGPYLSHLTGTTNAPTSKIQVSQKTSDLTVSFTGNSSTGNIEQYQWDTDADGTFEKTGSTLTHTFANSGRHTITLQVKSAAGVTDRVSRDISVGNIPQTGQWSTGQYDAQLTGYNEVEGYNQNLSVEWESAVPGKIADDPVIQNRIAYVPLVSSQLAAVETNSGELRWVTDLPGIPRTPSLSTESIYITTANARAVALDMGDGSIQWKHNLGKKDARQPVADGGRVYIATRKGDSGYGRNPDDTQIYALDARDGTIEWKTGFGNTIPAGPVTINENKLYFSASNGQIASLLRRSGQMQWKKKFSGGLSSSVTIHGGNLYFGTKSGDIFSVSDASQEVNWRYHAGMSIKTSLSINKNTVVAVGGNEIRAINSSGGQWKWTQRIEGTVSDPASITEQTIFISTNDGSRLYSLDIDDGSTNSNQFLSAATTTPIVTDSRVIVGGNNQLRSISTEGKKVDAQFSISIGDDRKSVTADVETSGNTDTAYQWDFTGDGAFEKSGSKVEYLFDSVGAKQITLQVKNGTNAIDTRTRRIVIGDAQSSFENSNANIKRTGKVPVGPTHNFTRDWKKSLNTDTVPIIKDNIAYVSTSDGSVVAVDMSDGVTQWSTSLTEDLSSPTISSDSAYLSGDDQIYAVDLTDGSIRWKHDLGKKNARQPIVDDGRVYIATRKGDSGYGRNPDDTRIYALDARDGTIEWKTGFGNTIPAGPVTLSANDLYVSLQDGTVASVSQQGGNKDWSVKLDSGLNSPVALSDGRLYAGTTQGTVTAIDISLESVAWSTRTGERIDHPPAIHNDSILVSTGGHVYAFDPLTGMWQWSTASEATLTTDLTVSNDTVYAGSRTAESLYGFDTEDGSKRIKRPTEPVQTAIATLNTRLLYGTRNSLVVDNGDSEGFSVNIQTSVTNRTVSASAKIIGNSELSAESYEWDFDTNDDVDAQGFSSDYTYKDSGGKRISLTVRSENNTVDTTEAFIIVGDSTDSWVIGGGNDGRTKGVSRPGLSDNASVRLNTQLGGSPSGLALINSSIFVSKDGGEVSAVDTDTGDIIWDKTVSETRPVITDDTIYGTTGDVVISVSRKDGSVRWKRDLGKKSIRRLAVEDGRVYVPTRKGDSGYGRNPDDTRIYSLDTRDGTIEWKTGFGNEVPTGPATLGEDELYVSLSDGTVASVDKLTGAVRWTEGIGGSSTAPILHNQTVYIGNKAGELHLIEAETGEERRNYSVSEPISGIAIEGSTVAVTHQSTVTVLDRISGEQRWKYRSKFGKLNGNPAISRGTIYIASESAQRVWGLDRRSGTVSWEHQTYPVTAGPAIGNGSIYYAAGQSIYKLEGATGGPSAVFETTGRLIPERPVRLNATRSAGYDNSIAKYEWDLNDDGTFDQTGETINFSWSSPGPKPVTLRVQTTAGKTTTYSENLIIGDITPPKAEIRANQTVIATGDTVSFDASASRDSRGINNYSWYVDNEQFQTVTPQKSYTFNEPGQYNVSVNVSDTSGNTRMAWVLVSVVSSFNRNITATHNIKERPQPGELVNASVEISANSTVDGPALTLDLPPGFTLTEQSATGGATFKPETTQWLWANLTTNETETVNYSLRSPADAVATESFSIRGSASGYAQTPTILGGSTTIEIGTCANRVIAGPDRQLTLTEVQRALHWWANDTVVPETDGTRLTMTNAQRLIAAWQTNTTVGCSGISLSGNSQSGPAGTVDATTGSTSSIVDVNKELSTTRLAPGESVNVTTTVVTAEMAPGIRVRAPERMKIVAGENNGGIQADGPRWIWTENGSKTLNYTLQTNSTIQPGSYALADRGSAVETDRQVAQENTTLVVVGDRELVIQPPSQIVRGEPFAVEVLNSSGSAVADAPVTLNLGPGSANQTTTANTSGIAVFEMPAASTTTTEAVTLTASPDGLPSYSISDQLTVTGIRDPGDLQLQNLSVTPTELSRNDSVTVTADITNTNQTALNQTLTLTANQTGALATATVTIPGNTTQTVTLTKKVTTPGTQTLSLNGQQAGTVTITKTTPPPVNATLQTVVHNVNAPLVVNATVNHTETIVETVTLVNPANQTQAEWQCQTPSASCAVELTTTPTESSWNGSGYEHSSYIITASDGEALIGTDTVATPIYIPGDTNGDGVVNIFDAVAIGSSWQAQRGQDSYSDAGDLNNDGVIDIFDAVAIGSNWQTQAQAQTEPETGAQIKTTGVDSSVKVPDSTSTSARTTADADAVVSINPQTTQLPANATESLTVDIVVNTTKPLAGIEISLQYDASSLNASISSGTFLSSDGADTSNPVSPSVNESTGTINYSEFRQSPDEPGITGNGTLFTLTFNSTEATLDSQLNLTSVSLSDPASQPIPTQLRNSTVTDTIDNETTRTPTASVTFTNQSLPNGSSTVAVESARFENKSAFGENFVVVIHETIDNGGLGPKIGESRVLEANQTQSNITVNLSKQVAPNDDVARVTESQQLVAMLHTAQVGDDDDINHGIKNLSAGTPTPIISRGQVTVDNEARSITNATVRVGSESVGPGGTATVNLTLDQAPQGLAGYNLTARLSVADSDVRVVEATAPTVFNDSVTETTIGPDNQTVEIRATDITEVVDTDATNASLGTVTVAANENANVSQTDLRVSVERIDDDSGTPINVTTQNGTVTVRKQGPLVPGLNPPSDPDNDGVFEDVNGNGRVDFSDVVTLFENLPDAEAPFQDFNGNGRIDFDDIVELFQEI
jgi:outer membrane protein assembly factor BamB